MLIMILSDFLECIQFHSDKIRTQMYSTAFICVQMRSSAFETLFIGDYIHFSSRVRGFSIQYLVDDQYE